MSSILEKVKNLDPNNSDSIKDVLGTFVQSLNKHTETDCYHWLTTLHFVVNRFPKYCLNHRNAIENHIKHFLESSNQWLVIEAAKCAHQLQQVRPLQEKTANAKSCWFGLLKNLCNSVHVLLQTIFKNSIDIYQHGNKFQDTHLDVHLPSTVLATALSQINVVKNSKTDKMTSEVKMDILCKRLNNLFVFIQAMLVEVYPVAKMVQPTLIFNVLLRTLSMSCTNDDDTVLGKHVSSIKVQALRTLDALIFCLNAKLIEYSPLVFRSILQTLRWSSEHPSKQYSIVRCQAYSSLSLWLTTLQCYIPNSRSDKDVGKSMERELVEFIIRDITPVKNVVELTMNTQSTKNLSKKAKRKLANTMLQQSAIAEHMPGEKNKTKISDDGNDDVAIAALSFAEVFIIVSGCFLQKTTYELLLSNLVNECYNLELYCERRALHLLKALEACRKSTRPDVPYAAKYCLAIYSKLRNSPHFEISSLCLRGILDIKMQLHGAPPSLLFEIERKENESTSERNKREVSEINKKTLEVLIDMESVLELDNENENDISIDEPQKKKSKMNAVEIDHFSISSKDSVTVLDDENEVITDYVNESVEVSTQSQNDSRDDKRESSEEKPCDEAKDNNITDHNKEENIDNGNDKNDVNKVSSNESLVGTQNSIMVCYGSPDSKNKKIPILEKMDGEDVCHSDSEDAILLCGQGHSPNRYNDLYLRKVQNAVPVAVVVNKPDPKSSKTEEIIENKKMEVEVSKTDLSKNDNEKSVSKNKNNICVSVEEMMADFVDETADDAKQDSERK